MTNLSENEVGLLAIQTAKSTGTKGTPELRVKAFSLLVYKVFEDSVKLT